MVIIIGLISSIISIMILYWIIITAISSSEMAKDIKELKEILKNQYPNRSMDDEPNTEILEHDNYKSNGYKKEAILEEECPACGGKVLSIDQVCGSCGLTLITNGDM